MGDSAYLPQRWKNKQTNISDDIGDPHRKIKKVHLIVIYRALQVATKEYTFLSTTHGIYSKFNSMFVHQCEPQEISYDSSHSGYVLWYSRINLKIIKEIKLENLNCLEIK